MNRFFSPCFLAACLFSVCLFSACMGLAEKSGHIVDGSAFRGKTIARFTGQAAPDISIALLQTRDKKTGETGELLILTFKDWPNLEFYGKPRNTSPKEEREFFLASCSYLSPSLDGWNESYRELYSEGSLILRDGILYSKTGPIETLDIYSGRIRRGELTLSGSEALLALRNRDLRNDALCRWMKNSGRPDFKDRKAFARYWKPILFPELVPAKKRPPSYNAAGARRVRAEDVRWNTDYSASVFTGELAVLRDSGTLLRDWDEAEAWIYLNYEWDTILTLVGEERMYIPVKK